MEVGPFCVVGPKVTLGDGTKLLSNVVVEGRTEMGRENTVFPFTVLGAVPQDLKYKGEDTLLVIGDHNTIRESVTMNLGTVQGGGVTRVGDHNLIMAYSHLGHDCAIGNHCILANNAGLAGHVTLQDYVTLGGMIGVSQFVTVGAYAYLTGQSGLEKDLPPFTIGVGSRPCNVRGVNIVGLRRRGFSADTIRVLSEVVKLWCREDVPKEQCLLEIESQYGEIPEVRQYLAFIRNSATGVSR